MKFLTKNFKLQKKFDVFLKYKNVFYRKTINSSAQKIQKKIFYIFVLKNNNIKKPHIF